ncbi:unnamed protein product [Rotaria sp. Silwood1]|nr:unnamed protein product [Rotaria sp. Silwood1]CAF1445140.1 unnamed protein product [Rotaria sp. Silwood1]
MIKILIFVAILCLGLVSARGFGGNRHDGSSEENNNNVPLSKLCDNITVAQTYVTQLQGNITALVNNGSFTTWLQQHVQEVAYIQNASNTDLLLSNCTAYFSGLLAARALDQTAQDQQKQYMTIADRLIGDVLRQFIRKGRGSRH